MRHTPCHAAGGKIDRNTLVVPKQLAIVDFHAVNGEVKKLFRCRTRIDGAFGNGEIGRAIRGKLHPYHWMIEDEMTQRDLPSKQRKHLQLSNHVICVS